jgi:2-polyprenyl-3-methyl-5-hydroxy-6-metoxy-1,4-benzoquinol methylase
MAIDGETEQARSRRRHRRTLFDGIAELYDDSRLGYPRDIVDFVMATAGVGAGSDVLEVGCGTGQLTESLATYGFRLTAIDIGASMVGVAQRRLASSAVSFQVASFEDFAGADASFDLIISANAFHWVDPEVKFDKPARLLRPGGWLALLGIVELYDDPLGAALVGMWTARSDDGTVWVRRPQNLGATEIIADTGLFGTPVRKRHTQRIVRPAETVIGVENTRATSLSWPDGARRDFTAELREQIGSATQVHLTQETTLTMARALPAAGLRG